MEGLVPLGRWALDIDEASGLAYHREEGALYVVSDRKGQVARVDLATFRERRLELAGARKLDCEGIAVSPDGRELWVAAEKRRRVLRFDLEGRAVGEARIEVHGDRNSGLEGLAVDRTEGRVYALHEQKPRLLLTLDTELREVARARIDGVDDLSGVDADAGTLWIVSDASRVLLRLRREGDAFRPDGVFALEGPKAEGVAVVGDRLFVAYDERLDGGENLVAYRRPS